MADSQPEKRRRFAPIPIETTFDSVRKPRQPTQPSMGPNPELTPEPSPRTPSPMPRELRERRRFAPQLIETSRRARRAGDAGPATRPTDKTDITPWTRNIYTARARSRKRHEESRDDEESRPAPPTRRETEDEAVREHMLQLASQEAQRQIEEDALAAFPNSRAREGGVAHFYFNESSEGGSPGTDSPPEPHDKPRARRKSSNLGITWWHKHMQEHAEQLEEQHYDRPEEGVTKQEQEQEQEVVSVDKDILMYSDTELDQVDISAPPDPLWTTTRRLSSLDNARAVKSTTAPHQASEPPKLWQPSGQRDPFNTAFGGVPPQPETVRTRALRQNVSPPMLGRDLTFRRCPSPKSTRLDTDQSFNKKKLEDIHRDTSGTGGLWGGYCFKTNAGNSSTVPSRLQPAPMIATPLPPATPADGYFNFSSPPGSPPAQRNGMFMSSEGVLEIPVLDDRLRKAQALGEKQDRIAEEFPDSFVTQVYNYLSLGYPATAKDFDPELSKISRVSEEELCRDDEKQMAKGHMLGLSLETSSEEDKCPRWKALRLYIDEWARQHPDLNNLDPLAWGVRERRGSWGL